MCGRRLCNVWASSLPVRYLHPVAMTTSSRCIRKMMMIGKVVTMPTRRVCLCLYVYTLVLCSSGGRVGWGRRSRVGC